VPAAEVCVWTEARPQGSGTSIRIDGLLKSVGFEPTSADPCVCVNAGPDGETTAVALYVDVDIQKQPLLWFCVSTRPTERQL